MSWPIVYSKQSLSDARLLKQAKLWRQANALLTVLRENPFQTPPGYEKLGGNLSGLYSRRINQPKTSASLRNKQKRQLGIYRSNVVAL